jgi:hypothetical protein
VWLGQFKKQGSKRPLCVRLIMPKGFLWTMSNERVNLTYIMTPLPSFAALLSREFKEPFWNTLDQDYRALILLFLPLHSPKAILHSVFRVPVYSN